MFTDRLGAVVSVDMVKKLVGEFTKVELWNCIKFSDSNKAPGA